jgi:hypothetical protein
MMDKVTWDGKLPAQSSIGRGRKWIVGELIGEDDKQIISHIP